VKDNVGYSGWRYRLGELYATAIMGLTEGTWRVGGYKTTPEEARGAFAAAARKKLDATTDATILVAASDVLASYRRATYDPSTGLSDKPELAALSTSYQERAVQLAPQDGERRRMLETRRASNRNDAFYAKLRGVPFEKQAAFMSALPDAERIERLPARVDMDFMEAEYQEFSKHDQAAAKAARDQTRTHADDLLALCDKLPNDPHRSVALFSGHVALAALAVHDNDTAAALRQLDEAVKAPPSEELKRDHNALWSRVAVGLLKRGERESVAQFLDRYSTFTDSAESERLKKGAAAIRARRMPDFYQYQVTPRASWGG
jgi:hypothetical protein